VCGIGNLTPVCPLEEASVKLEERERISREKTRQKVATLWCKGGEAGGTKDLVRRVWFEAQKELIMMI